MDLQLTGKTALITGSSGGIGLATAVGLAREGATVVLNGRDAGRLERAAKQVVAEVPAADVRVAVGDVATGDGAAAVLAAEPDVDILVNNAGTYGPARFADITDAEWSRYFETNVLSGVRLSRHYLARMLDRGEGRIIFVSSDAALEVSAEMVHYSVTKTAVLTLARGLAELTRGTNVTVNSVLPGPTATEGLGGVLDTVSGQAGISRQDLEAGFFTQARPSSLLQRFADPQEVANLIVYLASPLSAVTNGAAVRAEGGILSAVV
jgi:3-oxoacyl-[acyl-carrier protein] reductase